MLFTNLYILLFLSDIICIDSFAHKTFILFELNGHMYIYIAIIMYCQMLFLLFTSKQHCLHTFFWGGPTFNEYLSSCKISSLVMLWFWQYSSSTRLSVKGEDKEHEKKCFAVFPGCYGKLHLFLVNLFFFLHVLDNDVTRKGNNLKLKVKSEFSLLKYGLNADKP